MQLRAQLPWVQAAVAFVPATQGALQAPQWLLSSGRWDSQPLPAVPSQSA
jgi:hypothetical protein